MSIVGHGIDLVETGRIGELLDRHGDRFLARCFTEAERAHAGSGSRRVERLAGRFAAKEAVMKALSSGWRDGMAWTDIEIRPEPSGQPTVMLTGRALQLAAELGVTKWLVSISHISTHATASAIALGDVAGGGRSIK